MHIRKFVVSFLALLAVFAGTFSASAATVSANSSSGFLTVFDPATGQQAAIYCEGGMILSIGVIDGEESYMVGAPLGAPCSAMELGDNFVPIVNIDPHGKWVVAYNIATDTTTAFTCQRGGMTYLFAHSYQPTTGMKVRMSWHPGACNPGAMPG